MDILDLHGQMTAGQLAAESGLSTGAASTVLDRLEQVGYCDACATPSTADACSSS